MASQKSTEDEAQKRNTDCVYFLASPLTCKKGTDCEYRHSESARINPRDCWFWLSGNCLNPNCQFRHPPLDGRPAASSGPGISPVAPVPPTKRVPCFFFSQGFCAKGDKCAFLHGPQRVPNVEATSQKPLKPATIKSTESNDKQVSASKGNGSSTSKPLPGVSQEPQTSVDVKSATPGEAQFVDPKPTQPMQDAVRQNDTTKVMVAEGSGSSGPTKPSRHPLFPAEQQVRHVSTGENVTHQLQPDEERFRQVLSAEDGVQQVSSQVQPPDNKIRYLQSGEERMQNGVEPEDWWEESSPGFDVLVDDGLDQLIYTDDTEYLRHHDVLVEPGMSQGRGRLMRTDDLAEFEYDHPSVYEQSGYYDTSPGQYNQGSYDHYEQQLGYDNLNSYDRLGRQQAVLYSDRAMDGMLVRDRRGMTSEGDIRHSVSSNDLRNRIAKRRRLDGRTQQLFGDNHHRHSRPDISANDFQHGHRHHDDYPVRQEHLIRHHPSIQQGTRPNQRRSHSRAESGGTKRPYYEGSPERISVRSSPNKRSVMERLGTKSRERDRGRLISDASAVPLEVRGYTALNTRKAEISKDDMDFAAPKSLAQIKAEKRKASDQEGVKARDLQDEHRSGFVAMPLSNAAIQKQVVPLKSQILPAPGSAFDTAYKEALVGEDRKAIGGRSVAVHESIKGLDFEGPKPLSAILEAKRKVDLEGGQKSEEIRKEQRSTKMPCMGDKEAASACNLNSGPPFEGGLNKVEYREDHTPALVSRLQYANGINLQSGQTSYVQSPACNAVSGKEAHMLGMTTDSKGVGGVELQDTREGDNIRGGLGTLADMEVETEPGDNTLEDEDFGLDDDDEDDFAKKLGGFFS